MSGVVYFAESGGRIKIGYSTAVAARMRALGTGSPLPINLLATAPGTQAFERAIHAALSEHRIKGEWFYDCECVRDVMSDVLERGQSAIGFVDVRETSGKPRSARLTAALLQKAAELIHRSDLRKWLVSTTGKSLRTVDAWKAGNNVIDLDDLFNLLESAEGDKFFDVFLDSIPNHTRDLWLESKGFLPRDGESDARPSAAS